MSLNFREITSYLTNLRVTESMVKGNAVRTIGPEATLEDAAETMLAHRVNGLPVVEGVSLSGSSLRGICCPN